MTTVTLSLHDILHRHFGTKVTMRATLDIDELLACNREIAVIWGVEDVQSVRPDLTEDQAWEVLKFTQRGHDANCGLNWESLELAAEALYGSPDDADTSEGGNDEQSQ